MPRNNKSQRDDSAESGGEGRALALRGRSAVPVEPHRTAVRWTPGPPEVARPPSRSRLKRCLGWAAAAILLLVVVAPLLAWVRYQSLYVTSTNAAVRGHIAQVGTQIDGLVKTVEVDAGDRVVAGQILVRLDDRQLQAEVREATAELEGLRKALENELLEIAHQRRQIEQQEGEALANLAAAEAHAAAAEAQADEARRFHQVRESLMSSGGAVTGEDVREAESGRRTAEARLQEARAMYIVAQSEQAEVRLTGDALPIREQRIGVLEANVLRAEARLARAEADLESVLIRAPEDGAILRRIEQPGAGVETSQPLISMWLGNALWIEAWVDEDEIEYVRLGNEAIVTLRSFPDREFVGVVDRIGLATDFEMPASEVPQPRFSRMRGAPVVGIGVELRDPPPDLVPGMSATVAIRKPSSNRSDER